ncbi:MAG: metallophosphoesterase [Bacteroidota bacterium]
MRFAVFFLTISLLVGAAFFYTGSRLRALAPKREGPPGKRAALRGLLAAWYAACMVPFGLYLFGFQGSWLDMLLYCGFTALGGFSLTLTFVLGRDLLLGVRFLARRLGILPAGRRAPPPAWPSSPQSPPRRRFLAGGSNALILGGAAILTGYGSFEARRRPEVVRLEIPIPGLAPSLDGFRIAQFSDLHVGPTIKRSHVEEVVGRVNRLEADCVVFTGDLVDGSVSWLREDTAPLGDLRARAGLFFVTGNHDYYSGVEEWVAEAERLGFTVLLNSHQVIRRGDAGIVMAGITDWSGGDFHPLHVSDPEGAFRGAPEGMPRILLAHQPRSVVPAARAGFDLMLAGHTHGGQFFPWNFLASLSQPYVRGLHRHGEGWVYVNRGTGYWGPPLRIGVPPEITLITLRRAAGRSPLST